jgi:hypothetical protein
MTELDMYSLFQPLFSDIEQSDNFENQSLLLAHYTSLSTLEAILKNDEVWFSNPLFMNDMEEVRFVVVEGARRFVISQEILDAAGSDERRKLVKSSFDSHFNKFAEMHVLDTYVFCLSLYDANDIDGRLSMWRGYGSNGNGACLVIDSSKIPRVEESPLIFSKVHYASAQQRMDWIDALISKFCSILKASSIPDDQLSTATYYFFERIKLFALFTKHTGFKEEQEWRVVYMPDRDTSDSLKKMLHYSIGPRGIEPKLKFKVGYISGVTSEGLTLSKMIDRIVLGPTTSSPLAKATLLRVLDLIEKPELKERVMSSSIPFRAT